MSLSACEGRTFRIRTRLETALARLNGSLRASARRGEEMESMFTQWQNRWAGHRDDLVRRLEAIDSQLDVWQPSSRPTRRFGLVGAPEETCTAL